jgi:hypothetical protein
MLKNILQLKGVQSLDKVEQQAISGGLCPIHTEEDCILCGGHWGGLCALPHDSVCL